MNYQQRLSSEEGDFHDDMIIQLTSSQGRIDAFLAIISLLCLSLQTGIHTGLPSAEGLYSQVLTSPPSTSITIHSPLSGSDRYDRVRSFAEALSKYKSQVDIVLLQEVFLCKIAAGALVFGEEMMEMLKVSLLEKCGLKVSSSLNK